MAGDRVTTEYYLQFADHYFRVLNENRARFEEQRAQRGGSDDEFEGEDGGDEFETRDNSQRRDRGERNDRDRGERNDRGDRGNFRRDDERRERPVEQQPVEAAGETRETAEQPRGDDDQRRSRRPRRQREDSEPAEAFDADRLPPAIAVSNDEAEEQPAPRRRGRRPRQEGANDAVEVPPAA
jgi:hypothetical protein